MAENRTAGTNGAGISRNARPTLNAMKAGGSGKKRTARPSSGSGGSSPLAFSLWLFFGFLILLLDQLSKYYFDRALDLGDVWPVAPHVNFVLAHNRGAAFSFLANAGGWQRWFFAAFALAIVAVILRLLWRHGRQRLFALSLTLIAAGAMGNFLDRAVAGYVVDFIDLYYQNWHWPAFNVADIAICMGATGIVIDELRHVARH